MTIQQKSLLIVLFSVVGTIGMVYVISNSVVTASFQELENKYAKENTARVNEVLLNEFDHLSTFTEEYSDWDETYEFIRNPSEEFIRENLAGEAFANESYNMVAIYDERGNLVYGSFYDPVLRAQQPLPELWQERMSPKHPLFIRRDVRGRSDGILKMPDGRALLVRSNPILNSHSKGEPRGTLVIGELFDFEKIKRLAKVSKMSLRLLDYEKLVADNSDATFYRSLAVSAPSKIRIRDEQVINGFLMLKDIHEQPAFVLEISLPRDIYHQSQATLLYYTKLLLVVGAVTIFIVLLLMNQLVLSRLRRFGLGIRRVHETDDLKLHIDMDGSDELKYLAEVFNDLLDGLQSSRAELEKEVIERTMAEGEIRKSQDLYNRAELIGKLGYWEWDERKDCLISCSEQFARIHSMTIDKAITTFCNREAELASVHGDDRERFQNVIREALKCGDGVDMEYRIVSELGSVTHVHRVSEFVRDDAGLISRSMGTLQDISRQKEAQEKLELYQKKLRSLMSDIALAEEQERRRIAVALHDSTIQNLGLSKFRLAVFKNSLNKGVSTDILDEVTSTIDKAIQDTRNLVFELSPPILYELGFVPAIEWLAEQFYTQRGLVCEVYDDGQAKKLDDGVMVLLFQIVRELLVNISKHASASKAVILIDRVDERLRIQVSDNGVGFDISLMESETISPQGFGLFNITERLSNIDETIDIQSVAGEGTKITFAVPLNLTEEADS